jgi:hypothetical protein
LAESSRNLGKIVSIHGVQPALVQRAAIVAVLAFVFFLAMLAVFSYRQSIGYFVLASAFLVVEIFTLMGLFAQRRNVLQIFENGISYKKQTSSWAEIDKINKNKGYEIIKTDGEKIVLPATIHDIDTIVTGIESKMFRK